MLRTIRIGILGFVFLVQTLVFAADFGAGTSVNSTSSVTL